MRLLKRAAENAPQCKITMTPTYESADISSIDIFQPPDFCPDGLADVQGDVLSVGGVDAIVFAGISCLTEIQ